MLLVATKKVFDRIIKNFIAHCGIYIYIVIMQLQILVEVH